MLVCHTWSNLYWNERRLNGIIIDGVLHELKETKHKDCSKCSLRDLCQDEFGIACLCWINLASESEVINTEFKCRGKVTGNVSVEKAIEVLSSVLDNWVQTVSLRSLRKN